MKSPVAAVLLFLVASGCSSLPAVGGEGEPCFENLTCHEELACDSISKICVTQETACEGRQCGLDPTTGYDCGQCQGATDWCDPDGKCVDDCKERVCGESPNAGYGCGTCLGVTDWCDPEGQCADDCAGRACGESPNAGHDCGTCQGATDWCDPQGQCLDDCEERVCGESPNARHDCGECTGSDYCLLSGQCRSIDWIAIPGGTFDMGCIANCSPESLPVHSVTVPAFEIMKTEVTILQYKECHLEEICTGIYGGNDCNQKNDGLEKHPVNCASWQQAVTFCDWAGGRLPTEAEWEYAARNGSQDEYPWGDEQATCEFAVMKDPEAVGSGCNPLHTQAVCSKSAGNSNLGLCDMAGNVFEWVQDWYHDDYEGAPSDGSAWESPEGSQRVLRGGYWGSTYRGVRATKRDGENPVHVMQIGFRCVRD
ncbi:MAG: formylglycine-generating enzyme family protein [Deltaproteobacteria bacterium]|nr:formylglycine-generating enzyme family protein [Deltaproteobacteria bacterium]